MKRILAMLLVMSLMVTFIPLGAAAYETPDVEKIEFDEQEIPVNTQSRTSGFSKNYTLTGNGAADMVAIALAQEGRTGSDFGYTEEWCANFVSDCAILAGQSSAVPQYGGVSGLYSRVLSAGGTVTTSSPQPGDLCFIDWNKGNSMGHVEIVYAVSGTTVYTIGGNSGSGSTLYTRAVKKHAPLSSGYIVSIVRPNYTGSGEELPSEMTVTGLEMPKSIGSGSTPELSGTVSYANTITWLWVGIRYKDSTTTLSYAETDPMSYTYDLSSLLSQLDFAGLENGEYTLRVEATGGGQYWILYSSDFTVEEAFFEIRNLELPSSIGNGDTPSLTGEAVSNCTITWVWIGIRDKETNTTQSYAEVNPLSNTYNLDSLLAQLDFSGLENGDYFLQIEATGGGRYWGVVYLADFTIEEAFFEVRNLEMPSSIRNGETPRLTGEAVSNYTITWIWIGIRDKETNTTQSYAEVNPLSNTYNLDSLLAQLDFSGLENGDYFLQIEATGGGRYWGVVYLANFSVTDICTHSYERIPTLPTCTEQGYMIYTCTQCGDSYISDYTAALGHDYQSGFCTRCGTADPDYQGAKAVASGYSGDLTWVLTDDGVLTFSGSGKMKNYTYKSEMPWYSYLDQITSVGIEKGVTSIGSYAFYGMPNLKTITIPEGVTSIGDYAFKNCPVLNGVVLPTTLTQLGESAFYACTGLTSIEIPAKLYTVKPYTFKSCSALTSVTFHEGNLMKISDGAFYGTALTEVSFPDCLDIIDEYAFKNCSRLASITLGSGLTQIREAVFYGTAIPTIEIPEGVTSVGPYAFKNCTRLVSIDLPESLTSVGEASFYACTALESLDLPDAVTKIGNYAFRKCAALAEVSFGSSLVSIGESSFYGCESLIYLNIPEGVTTIQGYAFKGCTNLELVELPGSLVTLGDSAFHTCTSLSEITIPANVTKVGEYCFSGSTDIKAIEFLGNAPTIGSGAFNKITATAYYPRGNSTWTASVRQNYGGTITWTAQ